MKTWAIVIILIVLGLIGFLFLRDKDVDSPTNTPVATSTPTGATSTSSTSTSTTMIRVVTPIPNALIKSPVIVSGEARGNWYFEASFPVKILDAEGRQLGIVPAQAQGEWMTTNFVPFSVSLSFTTSTTDTGTLVLEKDNPSGLPEHAAEVRIPVRFR